MWTCKYNRITLALSLLTASTLAHSAQLTAVRFGSHQGFDRVVCEISEPVAYKVVPAQNGAVELHLRNVKVGEKFFLPKLPSQIKLLTSVEAFLEGEDTIILEIRGQKPLTAGVTELKGQTWRLALDLSTVHESPSNSGEQSAGSPAISKPANPQPAKPSSSPQYVPGDRPMETILADNVVTVPEERPSEEPKSDSVDTSIREAEPGRRDSIIEEQNAELFSSYTPDSLKALEILAEFYDVMGDQEAARKYARMYLERVDSGDALPPSWNPDSATMSEWMIALIALLAGIAGGVIGNRLGVPNAGLKILRRGRAKIGKNAIEKAEVGETAEELASDLDTLERAIASEKSMKSKLAVPATVAETSASAEVSEHAAQNLDMESIESDMKESLVDRRVKRVLELHAQKRSLADIAQELDMGQDEVKLIIDLNS